MLTENQVVVFYHANCRDGLIAGYNMRKLMEGLKEEGAFIKDFYRAINYRDVESIVEPFEDLDLQLPVQIIFVDFIPDLQQVEQLANTFNPNRGLTNVTILDHHFNNIANFSKSLQHHTLSSFPNAAIKQIVIKTKEPKKERIVKNIIRVTLEGRHADKVELIKELAILSDKYDIETINSDSIKFRKKVFKSTTNKTVSEKPIKNSLLKFPSPPLGFCTIPQFKGKYLINKEGKILHSRKYRIK